MGASGVGNERIADDAHRMGIGDRDRAGQQPGLADPLEPGQLAVAIEGVAAGVDGLGPGVAIVRDDDGDARPNRTLAHDKRAVAFDERGVAYPDARDVSDRVEGPRDAGTDDDAEVAGSHEHLLRTGDPMIAA